MFREKVRSLWTNVDTFFSFRSSNKRFDEATVGETRLELENQRIVVKDQPLFDTINKKVFAFSISLPSQPSPNPYPFLSAVCQTMEEWS